MQELTIRKATLNDLETLLRFEQGVINAERPFDRTLKTEHTNYYDIKEMIILPHIQIVVAELNGEIIGSGYARIENSKPYLKHQKHSYLGFMYVAPEHRGKGVNQKIIEALKQWSLSQNIKELRLEVYQDNHSAIKAYEKIGFAKHLIQMRMGLNEL
ncbi:MAG: GNAT family N-acetyltransferase [Chitinophagaceae bacterium]